MSRRSAWRQGDAGLAWTHGHRRHRVLDAPLETAASVTGVETRPPAFSHRQVLRVISGVVLCIFLAAIDQTVVIPAVPAIAADLHGFSHLAWVVSAYLLTATAATPVYGKLSDIYGRRALLLPAIVLFVVASLLCGTAQTLGQLIAARALQGLGGAGLMAMSQAAIADVVSPRERGRYQGYMAGAWGVASIAGPVLGGWMTDRFSWRYIFWVNLPIGVAAFALSARGLKLLPVGGRTRKPIDFAGAALIAAVTAASLLVMSWGGSVYVWSSAPVLGMMAAALALLALLVWRERRAADPLLPPRLFANATFVRGVAIAALAAAGIFGATFLLPLEFQLTRGVDAATSGSLLVPFLAANVVGAFSSGQLARRIGRVKPILLGGLVMSIAGFVLLAMLDSGDSHLRSVFDMALLGFGIGACMPTSLVLVQNAAEHRDVGAATGGLLFLRSMGGAFGSTLVGALLAARFAGRMRQLGVERPVDLSALRGHHAAGTALDTATTGLAQQALASGFHLAFFACAAMLGVALAICLGLRDTVLKSAR